MKQRFLYSSVLLIMFSVIFSGWAKYRVGLCIVATGRYDKYAEELIESARKFFCKNQDVHYFVFTDGKIQQANDVTVVYQKRLGWPYDTLLRFSIYAKHQQLLQGMDYLFATDADMRFVGPVGDEILAKLVATQHPGFVGKRGSYETRKESLAYVGAKEGKYYFAGGFYGGAQKEFFAFIATVTAAIEKDLAKSIIAVWHDESHLNRYFIDKKPTKILSPAYCYPESWNLPYEKKLLALDKNHSEMRK